MLILEISILSYFRSTYVLLDQVRFKYWKRVSDLKFCNFDIFAGAKGMIYSRGNGKLKLRSIASFYRCSILLVL